MSDPAAASPTVVMLDAMILRAEAACERYRRAAEAKGLKPKAVRSRRKTLERMESALAWLRAQREPRQTA